MDQHCVSFPSRLVPSSPNAHSHWSLPMPTAEMTGTVTVALRTMFALAAPLTPIDKPPPTV